MVFLDYAFPWLYALSMVIFLPYTISYTAGTRLIGKKAVFAVCAVSTFDLFVFSVYEGVLTADHTHLLSLMIVGTAGSLVSILLCYIFKGTARKAAQSYAG